MYYVKKVGTSTRMSGFERRLKLAANGLSPDQSRFQIMSSDADRRSCLPSGICIGSGLRPRKRLSQSAAIRNRSSGLRRFIFMHCGGPQGLDRLT